MANLDFVTSGLLRTTVVNTPKRQLPPLVLHPCDHRSEADQLYDLSCDEPTRRLLEARYAELRMLCFVGKDINRWLSQCLTAELISIGISDASLIGLLLFDPPPRVVRKMQDWNVGNSQVIFSRALGLSVAYPNPPTAEDASHTLLRDLHHYADALFDCRFNLSYEVEMHSQDYDFDVYSSAEYAKLLAKEWER